MRTTMKSTTLWEENKMKILEDYKKIAHELLFEVDDEKMIKYKDKDGESKEMKAGSAKTMPADHPAKQAWDKMSAQDGGDDKEEPSGQKLGGSDFDRDDTFGAPGSEVDKYLKKLRSKPGYDDEDDEGDIDIAKGKSYGGRGFGDDDDDYKPKYVGGLRSAEDREAMEKEYDVRIPKGEMKPNEDGEDDVAEKIADALAKKIDISREYAMSRAKEETKSNRFYLDFADSLESEFQEMVDDGGHQRYDEPMFDTQGMEKMKYGGGDDSGDSDDEENYSVRLSMDVDDAVKSGKLPDGTHQKTKLEDIDEDALEDFYGELTYDIAKEYDITQEIFADDSMYHLDDIAKKGGTLKDMYDSVISSAEEYAADEGTRKFDENKKPKKKPFLREQLERFGGGKY